MRLGSCNMWRLDIRDISGSTIQYDNAGLYRLSQRW